MSETEANKEVIQDFVQIVWREGNLDALARFWATDCVNHAMPGNDNKGLDALHVYHEQFMSAFAAFSDMQMDITQQIAEADRVVTYIVSRGEHSGAFFGIPPTGRSVSLAAIRIDRITDGKIAEHWSVSDMAGLMQQLQA